MLASGLPITRAPGSVCPLSYPGFLLSVFRDVHYGYFVLCCFILYFIMFL